jgi:SAM-dependent methyltransferase
MEATLERLSGRSIHDSDVLEIGAGQELIQLIYFATRVRSATGIDTDLVALQPGITDYVRMWRQNGLLRTFKTIARKALGRDAAIREELQRQLHIQSLPRPTLLSMDAAAMTLPSDSFDFVYSRAVFEHLADPRAVLREARRVLRPGGAAVIWLHLYTSDTGCHDTRIFAGRRDAIPYWSHLRPEHRHRIHENTFLNRLSLAAWRDIFASELPGSEVDALQDADQPTRKALAAVRADAQLSEYTDEELLSVTVEARWRNPR